MKNISKIILAVSMCLCLSCTAFAAPLDRYEIDDTTESVTIYGSVEGAGYLDPIAIEVLNAGVELKKDDVHTTESVKEDFIHITQLLADKNGGYKLEIDMSGHDADFYAVRVNGVTGENKFFFATTATKNTELGKIKLMCNSNQTVAVTRLVAALDSTNPDSTLINMFGITDELVDEVDAKNLATALYNIVKADATAVGSAANFKKAVEKATHLAAMNEGKGDAGLYGDELGISEENQKVYAEELSKEAKASFVADYFKGKALLTTGAAKKAYEEGLILAYAASIDSLADVTKIIESYGDEIGVDMSDYKKLKSTEKQELAEYITEKNGLDTLDKLKTAINDKIDDILDGRNSGGGSGSGSGGGGGGSMSAGTTGFTPVTTPETSKGFTDMAGSEWALEAVNVLSDKGVVSGVGSNMFAPARDITREEMLTMLLRAYNVDVTGASTDKFADVNADAWFAPYVAKGLELGVTSGISGTEFGVGKIITRQEAAAMAARIAKAFGKTLTAESEAFSDDAEIAEWAKTAVYELKNAGVIGGVGDGSFAPNATCTRAQSAMIVYQLIK